MSDGKEIKLFPYVFDAVQALEKCCGKVSSDSESATTCLPVAKSEVYNETWLLRLVLAFIHDLEFECEPQSKNEEVFQHIRKTVKTQWISEGGLSSVFELEGATWTDAILGNVELSCLNSSSCAKSDKKTKRAIKLSGQDNVGVVIIEAKVGSDLDTGVTHADDYNQVARNIACLARLVMDKEGLASKSRFVVFAPQCKIDKWVETKWIDEAKTIIQNQTQERDSKEKGGGKNKPRSFRDLNNESDFLDAIEAIAGNSIMLSWKWILSFIKRHPHDQNGFELLEKYYNATIDLYKINESEKV